MSRAPLVRTLVPVLLAVPALASFSCAGEEEPRAEERSTEVEEPAGEPAAGPGPGLRGDTVEVHMDEYTIEMPSALPPGELVFVVRNRGFEEHNLEIMHDGELLWEFDRPLNPGAVQRATVALEPGDYRVVCTVSGHDGRGMALDLVVGDEDGA